MKPRIARMLILASLLASTLSPAPSALAQTYAASGLTYLNVYFNDGSSSQLTTSGTGGISPYFPTVRTMQGSTGIGSPLLSYGSGSWLQSGSGTTVPLNVSFATPGVASGSAQYYQGTFFGGSNLVTSTSFVNPYGTTVSLTNIGFKGIAEMRLDWTTTYQYTGPSGWSAGSYSVGAEITDANGNAEVCVGAGATASSAPPATSWPTTWGSTLLDGTLLGGVVWMVIPTYVPAEMNLGISTTVPSPGNYFAFTGEETFEVTGASTTSATWEVPRGGDFTSFPAIPTGLSSGFLDSGVLGTVPGVFGFSTPGTVTATASTVGGGPLLIQDGDQLTLSGYLDVFVDPASVQVQVTPIVQPALAITNTASGPLVYFPMVTPGNHVLQMSTNLLKTNWVAVTGGIPATVTNKSGEIFGGLIITNKARSAFFRLH